MAQEKKEQFMFVTPYDYIDKLVAYLLERPKALAILEKAQAEKFTYFSYVTGWVMGSNKKEEKKFLNEKNKLMKAEQNVYLRYFLNLLDKEIDSETSLPFLFIKNLILEFPDYKSEFDTKSSVIKIAKTLVIFLKKNLSRYTDLKIEPQKIKIEPEIKVNELEPHVQNIKLIEGQFVPEKGDNSQFIYYLNFFGQVPTLTLMTQGIFYPVTLSDNLKNYIRKEKINGLQNLTPSVLNCLKTRCFEATSFTFESVKIWVEREYLRSLDEFTQESKSTTFPTKAELRSAFIINLNKNQLEWVDSLGHLRVIPQNENVSSYIKDITDKIVTDESIEKMDVLKLRLALDAVDTAKTVSLEKKNTIESALSGQFLSKKTVNTRVYLENTEQMNRCLALISPQNLVKGKFKSSFILMPNLEKLYWVNAKNVASELNLKNYLELYSWFMTKPNYSKEVELHTLKQHLAKINVNLPGFPEIKNPTTLKVHLNHTHQENETISLLSEKVATRKCQSSFILMPVLKKLYWINIENKVFELLIKNYPELDSWLITAPDFSNAGHLYQLKQYLSKITVNLPELLEIKMPTLPVNEAMMEQQAPKVQAASFLAAQQKISHFFIEKNTDNHRAAMPAPNINQTLV